MKIFTIMKVFLFSCFVVAGLNAQKPYVPFQQSPEHVDMATILLLKSEFETAKKVLIQIRDSQNPSLIKSGVSTLGTIVKEIVYITSALFFGGGSLLLGAGAVVGPEGLRALSENPLVVAGSLVVFPVTIITSYIILKLIFGRLLASSDPNVMEKNIQEALMLIDQTLNKLDYEIRKIEHLIHSQQAVLE